MEKKKLTLLKLGGSLITDKTRPYTAENGVIAGIAKQIKEAIGVDPDMRLIISIGAGSYGHYEANRSYCGKAAWEKTRGHCLLQDSVARLNRLVIGIMLKAGINCMSFQPSAFIISGNNFTNTQVEVLERAMEKNIVPVLYSDILFDREKGESIHSSEMLFQLLVPVLADAGWSPSIVYAGKTKGVHDKLGNSVKNINAGNIQLVLNSVGKARGYDVSGGMRHKIELSWHLARKGIKSMIIDGTVENNIRNILLGRIVTDCSAISEF